MIPVADRVLEALTAAVASTDTASRAALLVGYRDHLLKRRFSFSTINGYLIPVRKLFKMYPGTSMADLTPLCLQRYLNSRPVKRHYQDYRGLAPFFAWLLAIGALSTDPCVSVRRPPKHPESGPAGKRAARVVPIGAPEPPVLFPYRDYLVQQEGLNRLGSATRRDYLQAARRFLGFYAKVPLEQITPEHVEHFLIERRIAPRSMHSELLRLRAFFRWLVDCHHLLKDNPCDRAHRPRWFPAPRPAPSEAEFVALCRVTRTLQELVMVEVLYHTGLRIGEFLQLQVGQVDLDRRLIRLTGKGRRLHEVPFTPQLADLLGYWIGAHKHGWVFSWRQDCGRSRGYVGSMLRRLGREIGLSYPLTAHLLRHGLARTLKTSEMPLAAIQQVLRHQKIQTTIDMYGRLQSEDVRSIYDKHMGGRP